MQDQQQQEQEKLQYAPQQDGKPKPNLSVRASRRSELHHATMAGKGGLLLNKDSVKTIDGKSTSTPANTAANEDNNTNTNGLNNDKPTAAWDLEDCRTWLLEASRNIAQTWVDERKTNTLSVKNIPNGPQAELEGQLVEHTFRLCEHLEAELQARASTDDKKGSTQQKVVTPRLTDMTKLGIKWQHSHERGSGGRGGIGGSGASSTAGVVRKNGSSRTAGQILLLKTAKKLGSILNDPVAGDAIHRELRNLIGKQEALKQKEMRDEATRQRLNQMQRKPWLAARLQQ